MGLAFHANNFTSACPRSRPHRPLPRPSIGDFSTRYESLLTRGCDHILSVHAAGALTSILNVARQASNDFPERVTVWIAPPFPWGSAFSRA